MQCQTHIPQVIAFTQHKIALRVERRAHLAETAITTTTFEAILVPQHVEGAQQVTVLYVLATTGAQLATIAVVVVVGIAVRIADGADGGETVVVAIRITNIGIAITVVRILRALWIIWTHVGFRFGDVHSHHLQNIKKSKESYSKIEK